MLSIAAWLVAMAAVGMWLRAPTGISQLQDASVQTDKSSETERERDLARTPAEMLAVIDSRDAQPPSTLVARYEAGLEKLHGRCTESDERLADILVTSKNLLSDEGHDRTLMQLSEMLDESLPARITTKCADVMAVNVLLITKEIE